MDILHCKKELSGKVDGCWNDHVQDHFNDRKGQTEQETAPQRTESGGKQKNDLLGRRFDEAGRFQ